MEKLTLANGKEKKVGIVKLISDKVNLKSIIQDREGHCIYNDKELNIRRGYNIC